MDFSDRKRLETAKAHASAFIQHFPEAGLDPDATAETFMERQDRAGGTRAITLKQLHRQITRYHTCTADDIARAYIHAPAIGIEPADRTIDRLKYAASFFGLKSLLDMTLNQAEEHAWLLAEPVSTFNTHEELLRHGQLKTTGLSAEEYIQLVQANPKILRADSMALVHSLAELNQADPPHKLTLSQIAQHLRQNPPAGVKRNRNLQSAGLISQREDPAHDLSDMLSTISVNFKLEEIREIYKQDPSLEKISPADILDHVIDLEMTNVGLDLSIYKILTIALKNPQILQRKLAELDSVTQLADAYSPSGFTIDDATDLMRQDLSFELLSQPAEKTISFTTALLDTLNQLGMGGDNKPLTGCDVLTQPGLAFYHPQLVTDGPAACRSLIKKCGLHDETENPHAAVCTKITEHTRHMQDIGIPPAQFYRMLCLDLDILKLDSGQVKAGYDKLMTVHGPQGLTKEIFLASVQENPKLLEHLAKNGTEIADKVSLLLPSIINGYIDVPPHESPYSCILSHKWVLAAPIEDLARRVAWVERPRRRTAKPFSPEQYLTLNTGVMAADLNAPQKGLTAEDAAQAVLARFTKTQNRPPTSAPREKIIQLPEIADHELVTAPAVAKVALTSETAAAFNATTPAPSDVPAAKSPVRLLLSSTPKAEARPAASTSQPVRLAAALAGGAPTLTSAVRYAAQTHKPNPVKPDSPAPEPPQKKPASQPPVKPALKGKAAPGKFPATPKTIEASIRFGQLTGAFGGPAQIKLKPIDSAPAQKSKKPRP